MADAAPGKADLFRSIATPAGAFAMVAMDQRESLRSMLEEHRPTPVPDQALTAFKLDVVTELSPRASAILIDVQFGLEAVLRAGALAPGCGLMVASDSLVQEPGGPVTDTSLDRSIDPQALRRSGASALKILVIWRPDRSPEDRAALVTAFVGLCHRAGLLALVEPVIRPPQSRNVLYDREAGIVQAARELGPLGMDVYKAEVPMYGRASQSEIARRAERVTAALPCPWVVLSQGVEVADFPAAVEASCRGGASGFLAGRAIWSDVVGAGDHAAALREVSVPRLQGLRETVDRLAQPWTSVVSR